MGAEPARARVFFALWPEPALAARLDALGAAAHAHCAGRRTRRETLHLTLAFIGDVETGRLAELVEAAEGAPVEPFTLTLDRLGSWRHNRIAWAGTHHVPQALAKLASGLDARLRAAGFPLERRPFFPHVTLLRRIESPFTERAIAPLEWRVERFVLVRSQRLPEGARYERLAAWPRGTSDGAARGTVSK